MARGRGFWGRYAGVSDDIRQKVVEEGWSGHKGGWTKNIDEKDMPALKADEHKGTVWAQEAVVDGQSQDSSPMAGIGTMGDERSNWENVQGVAQDEAQQPEITSEDLYGRDAGEPQEADNVWGHAPGAEIGPPEQEPEQEM